MRYLLTLAALFCFNLNAAPHSQRIDSSSTNIPTAFSSASTSKLANITGVLGPKILCVDNRSAVEVAVNCSGATSNTVPSDSASSNVYVNATQAACFDSPMVKGTCYIRSMGSAISSGIVVVTLFAQD